MDATVQRSSFSRSYRNLPFPGAFGQAQRLDTVLPPWTSALLPPQVLEHLLSSVHQQPQIPLVVLVSLPSQLQNVGERLDLCSQKRNLDFW